MAISSSCVNRRLSLPKKWPGELRLGGLAQSTYFDHIPALSPNAERRQDVGQHDEGADQRRKNAGAMSWPAMANPAARSSAAGG